MATEAERIWSEKTDDQLLEAGGQLGQFTAEGQRVIRAELVRRGYEDPVEQGGEAVLEATGDVAPPPRECSRCSAEMKFLGTRLDVASWTAGGDTQEAREKTAAFDVYVCPQCAHVEFFYNFDANAEATGDDE